MGTGNREQGTWNMEQENDQIEAGIGKWAVICFYNAITPSMAEAFSYREITSSTLVITSSMVILIYLPLDECLSRNSACSGNKSCSRANIRLSAGAINLNI